MTKISYQRLFQLEINHSYFQRGVCRCLEFNAEAATVQLMKRFRLLIRRQVNGFCLYADSSQSAAQLFAYIKQATGQDFFTFEIRTDNPDFNFFTALPANWVGQLIYNSGDGMPVDNKFLLKAHFTGNAGTPCIGKVTLRFDDILAYSGETGYAGFDISFEARATQWQYYIINRSEVPLSDPAISGIENINFEGPEKVKTATGESAILFSSGSKLIPLSEECIYKFDLVNRPASTGSGADKKIVKPKMIIKGLPNPAPQWIGKADVGLNAKDSDQLSSPMYIYL